MTIKILAKRIVEMMKMVMMMIVWFRCHERKTAIARKMLNQIVTTKGLGQQTKDGM